MTDRDTQRAAFLSTTGWGESHVTRRFGDASHRSYDRLRTPHGTSAILMDAPPDTGEDVRPFLAIARHLHAQGLSAPQVLAADETAGFLLLEDLGDTLFARWLEDRPEDEITLYRAAVDVLLALRKTAPPPGLAPYDAVMMADLAGLSVDWWAQGGASARADLTGALATVLSVDLGETCLALRDYHAENLIWLPDRGGLTSVGLLDFQDALLAPAPYDLVSLLKDARRDVSPTTQAAMMAHYARATGTAPRDLAAMAARLGVQRNLRILGVFARLARRDGKPQYLTLMPRVWAHLQADLAHPDLRELQGIVTRLLPAPPGATP